MKMATEKQIEKEIEKEIKSCENMIETANEMHEHLKPSKIKFTAIWRDGGKRVFSVNSFICSVFRKNSYYIKLDDGYTFACDAIEIEQQ